MLSAAKRGEALALALLLLCGTASAAPVDAPVAVMPFKNISGELSLDWLKVGIAETLVSDLQKGAHLRVVERSQLDHALAELALQNSPLGDDATASQVGKLTGAQTVVVGSFQADGKQLRIAARFVRVSTGEVLDTAKVTGPLDDIFLLQDQIVAKLTGQVAPSAPDPKKPEAAKAAARAPRKRGPREVKAYQLYAMSLTTASDADKVGYLRQSLVEDPELTYALDELSALESRMKGYRKVNEDEGTHRESEAVTKLLRKEGTPQERSLAAIQLLAHEVMARHYQQLLVDGSRIASMDLPAYYGQSPTEAARYNLFFAHKSLYQTDLALQAGERYMRDFPGGTMFQAVDLWMKQLVDEKRSREDGKAKLVARLAEMDAEEQKLRAQKPGPASAIQLLSLGLRRCREAQDAHQYERAIELCRAFAQAHAHDGPEALTWVNAAIHQLCLSELYLGRFEDVRRDASLFKPSGPDDPMAVGIRVLVDALPPQE